MRRSIFPPDVTVPPRGFTGALSPTLYVWRHVYLEQDKMDTVTGPPTVTGMITNSAAGAAGQFVLTTDQNLAAAGQFEAGILRTGGTDYPVITNAAGANATVTVISPPAPAPAPANGSFELFTVDQLLGDTLPGQMYAVLPDPGGVATRRQVDITGFQVSTADEYTGGLLRVATSNYPIVLHWASQITPTGPATAFIIDIPAGNAAPSIPLGVPLVDVRIFDDDWQAVGNNPPTVRADPRNDANLYDLMQASPDRNLNRFADAYIEPEYHALDDFDSSIGGQIPKRIVPGESHLTGLWDIHFFTILGTSYVGSDSYESPIFWVSYVSTAFQDEPVGDRDPDSEGPVLGRGDQFPARISVIYLESHRDNYAIPPPGTNEAVEKAKTTLHEVGHQFYLANPLDVAAPPAGDPVVGHRNDTPNIMSVGQVAVGDYFFHDHEKNRLRVRLQSPGRR